MTTEQYSIGYEAGYQDGWNEAQKPFVGLTYEDMVGLQKELFDKHGEMVLPTTFAMAVEAKLKDKNI